MNLEEKRGETGGTQAKVTLQNLAGRWAGICAGQGKLGYAGVVVDTCSEAGHVTWSDPWWVSAGWMTGLCAGLTPV